MARRANSGMKKGYKYDKKKKWYNNGVDETQVFEDRTPPEGYVEGRLKRGRPAWNTGLTKETNESVKKISESIKKNNKSAKTNHENKVKRLNARIDFLLDEYCQDNTFIDYYDSHFCKECLEHFKMSWEELNILIEKFNLESPKEHRKRLDHKIYTDEFRQHHSEVLKGKNTWSKGSHPKESSKEKQKETFRNRTEEQKRLSKEKEYLTRKKNGTLGFHKTRDEKKLEEILISLFGEDNVRYNYFDVDRYPFKCDFYIPSEDLFIELHAGWEHQEHAFNADNDTDKLILENLKTKREKSEYYENVIYQWTNLDVRKLNTFINNGLNYIIGYSVGEVCEVLKDKGYTKNSK